MTKIINYSQIEKEKYIDIDTIYKNGGFQQSDAMTILMKVRNGGGFRPCRGKSYFVIHSTKSDIDWPDFLDYETGIYTYYGDNKEPGCELHSKMGNQFLRNIYEKLSKKTFEDRKEIPPIFLFESKKENSGVQFKGLLVPGNSNYDDKDILTAVWASKGNGERFQNYRAIFTLLDTMEGSKNEPNKASIDLRWLDDIKNGKSYDSIYAPLSYKKWVKTGIYTPFSTIRLSAIRTKKEQLPNNPQKLKMLKLIHDYFYDKNNKHKSTRFEPFALWLSMQVDQNIIKIDNTRPTRDGGRDGIGQYRIMGKLNNSLTTVFAVEAKCYDINDPVRVKETSRLISRIRQRQFGILVTTSFVAKQAYEEIIEDGHPIAIISGVDIIDILYKKGINNITTLNKFLNDNYPKDLK